MTTPELLTPYKSKPAVQGGKVADYGDIEDTPDISGHLVNVNVNSDGDLVFNREGGGTKTIPGSDLGGSGGVYALSYERQGSPGDGTFFSLGNGVNDGRAGGPLRAGKITEVRALALYSAAQTLNGNARIRLWKADATVVGNFLGEARVPMSGTNDEFEGRATLHAGTLATVDGALQNEAAVSEIAIADGDVLILEWHDAASATNATIIEATVYVEDASASGGGGGGIGQSGTSNVYVVISKAVVAGSQAPTDGTNLNYNGASFSGLGDWTLGTIAGSDGMDVYMRSVHASRDGNGVWTVTVGDALQVYDGEDVVPVTVLYYEADGTTSSQTQTAASRYVRFTIGGVAGALIPIANVNPIEGHIVISGSLNSGQTNNPFQTLYGNQIDLDDYDYLSIDLIAGLHSNYDDVQVAMRFWLPTNQITPVTLNNANGVTNSSVLIGVDGIRNSYGRRPRGAAVVFKGSVDSNYFANGAGFNEWWTFNFVLNTGGPRNTGAIYVFKKSYGYPTYGMTIVIRGYRS